MVDAPLVNRGDGHSTKLCGSTDQDMYCALGPWHPGLVHTFCVAAFCSVYTLYWNYCGSRGENSDAEILYDEVLLLINGFSWVENDDLSGG